MGCQSLEEKKRNPHTVNCCVSLAFAHPCTGNNVHSWAEAEQNGEGGFHLNTGLPQVIISVTFDVCYLFI